MIEQLNMIRQIAWSYTRTHPEMEFDDLFSEACLACLEASPRYDSSKGKRTTYYHHVAHSHLNNLIQRESRRTFRETVVDLSTYEEVLASDDPEPEERLASQQRWEEMLTMLSPEAQMVCSIITNEKAVFLPMDKPKHCRGIISRLLRGRGWSWNRISCTFQELKQATAMLA